MNTYDVEMVDELEVELPNLENGLYLQITDDTLLNDVTDYLVPLVYGKRKSEELLTISVNLEGINTRKIKQLMEIFRAVLIYFDTENIVVLWNYEATDEKAYDTGMILQHQTEISFSFQVY